MPGQVLSTTHSEHLARQRGWLALALFVLVLGLVALQVGKWVEKKRSQ